MEEQLNDIGATGPKHRSSARRRRRLGAPVGALLTGAALLLGTAGMADAATHTYIEKNRVVPLVDNCRTGFTGSVTWTDGADNDTVTLKFTPPAGYTAADADIRGDAPDPRRPSRDRVVRLRDDFPTLQAGVQIEKTFTTRSDIKVWRVSVGAIKADALATEVHALEAEDDPLACD